MNPHLLLTYAWLIPLLPFLAFAIIGLGLSRRPRVAAGISIASIAVSFFYSLLVARVIFTQGPGTTWEAAIRWLSMPGLRVDMGLLIDPLAAVMLLVVTSVALLVQIYSLGYMRGDPGLASYFAYQSIFAASMLGLVLANNFGQLFVFWELVGLCSYLLIGFWFGKNSAKEAAKKAFVTNRVGDFGLLLGILFIQLLFGTLNFGQLAGRIGEYSGTAVLVIIAVLVLAGPVGKSAQFPLHVWLPDAMEGPTPVSALIHAATMVAAGVYLIARAFFIFNSSSEVMMLIAIIGGFTALFAATIALVQNDIKRILAYSTLSQLGYMVMAMGLGAMAAGMFHLVTHAYFKSLLFLAAGSVIHALDGEQEIWKMGGLARKMPVTTWTFVIGALALSGIPPLSGFWSKDEILLGAYAGGYPGFYLLGSVVALLTAFYMFRLIFVVFWGRNRASEHAHESPSVMTVPLVVLAAISVVVGFLGAPVTNNVFARYISFAGASHHHPSLGIMLASTIIALTGIALAYLVYQKELIEPALIREKLDPVYKLLYHKYYIDEVYAWLIKHLVDGVGKLLFWFDLKVINGLVDAIAMVTGQTGNSLKYTENGQVQSYALYIFAGIIIILLAIWMAGVPFILV